jgi:hypothetical protein
VEQIIMQKTIILTLMLLGLGINSAIAQMPNEEEKFDDAIQQFGYVSGAAFQCAKAKQQAPMMEREVMRVFSGITRLFGSDRAFFYAAAYGAGATATIDRAKCADYTRQFQQSIQKTPFNR